MTTLAEVRARWHGHGIRAEVAIHVAPEATVAEAHQIADHVRQQLAHDIDHITDVAFETRPANTGARRTARSDGTDAVSPG